MSDEITNGVNGHESNGAGEMMTCPSCERPISGRELSEHRGVCSGCMKVFARAHRINALTKRQQAQEHINFDDIHHDRARETEWFDFDSVFAADEHTLDYFEQADKAIRHDAGTALGMVLDWCWACGWVTAQRRFAAITAGLRPDLLDDASYQEIGEKTGCGKGTISKAAVIFQRQFRLKFSRGRSEEARRNMSDSQMGHKPTNIKLP